MRHNDARGMGGGRWGEVEGWGVGVGDGGVEGGGGAIINDVLKFRKVIELESSFIVICFSYIYLIIDGKRSIYQLFKNL